MPDYGEILEFLAKNPPQLDAERELHASLLELLAVCLRTEEGAARTRRVRSLLGKAAAERQARRAHVN